MIKSDNVMEILENLFSDHLILSEVPVSNELERFFGKEKSLFCMFFENGFLQHKLSYLCAD